MKESEKKIILILLTIITLVSIGALLALIYVCATPKVVYNIDRVENFIVPENNNETNPIVYSNPINNLEKETNIIVYSNHKSSDLDFFAMGFTTPVYKYLDLKINGWTLNERYQKILYEKCKKYNVNYIKALAIAYKEGSRNNPYAEHRNANGTIDIGIMQFNSSNKDIIKKITNSTDLEHLKNPETNIECAVYLMWRNENYYKDVDSLYDTLVIYNGGYGSVQKIKEGTYSLNCPASQYAAKVISYMNELYSQYINQEV